MVSEIEIEKKNLLTQKEYQLIYDYFELDSTDSFSQTNSYFDTKDLQIKNTKSALRIRTKMNFSEVTLKTPYRGNLLEINVPMEVEQANFLIKQKQFKPTGDILDKLVNLGLSSELTVYLLTQLSTKRIEKPIGKGLLVLDHSWYGESMDYELEIEAKTNKDADELFTKILSTFSIPQRKTENKINRAMKHLK